MECDDHLDAGVLMRIVGGTWRSRVLVRPVHAPTRPMPDRMREAIFAMLGSYYHTPGALPPLRVADVFCGGGSMGLEALSRGAASCRFFERDPVALDALRRNLAALGVTEGVEVVRGNAWRNTLTGERGDQLILLDPPYRDAEDVSPSGPVRSFLAGLVAPDDGGQLVVLHHPRRVHFDLDPGDAHRRIDERVFGTNAVAIFER